METKFTKGEWKTTIADCSDYLLCAVISESEDRVICHTTVDNKMSKEEQKANAKLIAAAPEMFNALEELLAQVKQFTDGNIGEQDYFRDEISNAKKAIKKATE